MEQNKKVEPMPILKSIPMILAALIMVVGVSAVAGMLNLCIWTIWLGMCIWASFGMSLDMKDILQVWGSASIGIFMGYNLLSGTTVGLVIGGIMVAIFIVGMVTHRFPHYSHNYTAIFLTVCTGSGLILEPAQLAASVLFGFVVFGLIPWGVVNGLAKKKAK
ncbi:hypothetical protein [Blautia marasmi]|uniref:hypothetical protein n=1 Tax=Blautia marasmi TaxID=1917868 RepID=UPI00266C99D9|nr:hypothetical protein [Blautia marasmi]